MEKALLKYRIGFALGVLLVPLTIVFFSFFMNLSSKLENEIAQAHDNALQVYHMQIINEMSSIEEFLLSLSSVREEERALREETVGETAWTETEELFLEFLDSHIDVFALAQYNEKEDNCLITVNPIMGLEWDEEELRTELIWALQNSEIQSGWFVWKMEESVFWMRTVKQGDSYSVCIIDLARMARNAAVFYRLEGTIIFLKNGVPLIERDYIEQNQLSFSAEKNDYYFSDWLHRNLVLQEPLVGLTMVYVVSSQEEVHHIRLQAMLFIIFAAVAAACTLLVVWYFRRHILRPVGMIIEVMEKVEKGELDTRIGEIQTPEFEKMRNAFNHMLDEIVNLRIEKYEQKLAAERMKMETLRLQIRPHFYLNCLKSIYSLTQWNNRERIQAVILKLSSHLRYVFDVETDRISLKEELRMCENYIELQKEIGSLDCSLELHVDAGLLELWVPPVSLLSFVENSFKYGQDAAGRVVIELSVHMLEMDGIRIADIILRDRGSGFGEEQLRRLNDGEILNGHVGISNVTNRFRLLYGERFAISFRNMEGAWVEVLLTLEE